MRRFVCAVVIGLAALIFALPATAGKPQAALVLGNGSGAIPEYAFYTVVGCGYPRSATFTLEWERSWYSYESYFTVYSDAAGCLVRDQGLKTVIFFEAGAAGTTQEITIIHGSKILAQGVLRTVGA